MERGQRRITVNYARRQGGRSAYMNQSSHLPLKLNMAGVIPPIFASADHHVPGDRIDLVRPAPANAEGWQTLRAADGQPRRCAPGEPLHMLLYGALIIGFAFFYTALVFNSQETADNLKKSGALIPGIRPGKATADYIDGVLTRLTAVGAAVPGAGLPAAGDHARQAGHVPFYFGGTSLLIVVVVVMDFIAQIQAHLMSHQYESLLKKANLKGGSRGGFAPRREATNDGRLARRSRARVGQDRSVRWSSARAGPGGFDRPGGCQSGACRRSMGTLPMPGSRQFRLRGLPK